MPAISTALIEATGNRAVAGLWLTFLLTNMFAPMPTLVAATRTAGGLAAMLATAAIAGWLLAMLTYPASHKRHGHTSLAMALVAESVATGGTMLEPRFVACVKDPTERVIARPAPSVYHRAMTPEVASVLTGFMRGVVEDPPHGAPIGVPQPAQPVVAARGDDRAVGRQGFIQPFAREAGFAGEIHHAACAGDFTERGNDQCRIAIGFVDRGLQIQRALLLGFQISGSVVRARIQLLFLCHGHLLQHARQFQRGLNVLVLRRLGAAGEQNDQ